MKAILLLMHLLIMTLSSVAVPLHFLGEQAGSPSSEILDSESGLLAARLEELDRQILILRRSRELAAASTGLKHGVATGASLPWTPTGLARS